MAYTAEITRSNPSCFVFMVDQSGSMDEKMAGAAGQRKCDVVADALNRLLQEISVRCAKEEGIRDYFHVSVIGYGAKVQSALGGSLVGLETVPISKIAMAPSRIEVRTKKSSDGAGGLFEQRVKFPVWVDPVASGGTPMTKAFLHAKSIVEKWLEGYPCCFPPVVMNLTDGESTDGAPAAPAESLRRLCSADGSTLLFNLHVCSDNSEPATFPDSELSLSNAYAKQLFQISSVLPPGMREYAATQGYRTSDGTRGFVFNADATSLVQFLDIGTRATRHLLR